MVGTIDFWLIALLASFTVGLSKGGIPAIGMLSVPILTLTISPVMAVGILLPVYIVTDMFGVWVYRKDFSKKVLYLILPGAFLGTLIAWMTAEIVPAAAVTLLIGLIGFAYSLKTLIRPLSDGLPAKPKVAQGFFWGTITGITSFVSYAGAPPFQIYVLPLRLAKTTFIGTSTIAFAILNLLKIVPYSMMGEINLQNLKLSFAMALPAAIAVYLGVWIVKVIPTAKFFKAVIWALLLLSIKLLWDGASGLGWL
ncbi:sulfite exporter TauE/SafE family protein [Brucellaceae bacterium C25G]